MSDFLDMGDAYLNVALGKSFSVLPLITRSNCLFETILERKKQKESTINGYKNKRQWVVLQAFSYVLVLGTKLIKLKF